MGTAITATMAITVAMATALTTIILATAVSMPTIEIAMATRLALAIAVPLAITKMMIQPYFYFFDAVSRIDSQILVGMGSTPAFSRSSAVMVDRSPGMRILGPDALMV